MNEAVTETEFFEIFVEFVSFSQIFGIKKGLVNCGIMFSQKIPVKPGMQEHFMPFLFVSDKQVAPFSQTFILQKFDSAECCSSK